MELVAFWFASFGLIFAIIDPLGYIPVFLAMTADNTEAERRRMLLKACGTAFFALAAFTLIGSRILAFFGISIPALQISGGLLLLSISGEMLNLFPFAKGLSEPEKDEAVRKADISIVPLAIPLLSGPASIATVVVLSSKCGGTLDYLAILFSVGVTLLATYFSLSFADKIFKRIGVTGVNVVTRIMGLLLCAMAVQFIINGWQAIR
ncbi:MAG: hypothetical protein A2X36_03015 [Elusimicrobia bacterium GWA2_69_24]|nr:MAG: hypothetical protein A2X36_03015 [Elusimicrobia bacterium GWA2_69_24]HBL17727.1 hypothetical protein [Elusimicrobiota bacterium]